MGLLQFLAALAIFHQDKLKRRINRITATWRNGCFGKMDDYPLLTIPKHHLARMDVLTKTFVQIILAAKQMASAAFKATTFAFSSVFIFLLWCGLHENATVYIYRSAYEWIVVIWLI